MPEPRVDRHDQHLIDVLQDLFQYRRRGRRVDDDTRPLPERLDVLQRAVQVVVAFPVNEQRIGAGLGKVVEERIGFEIIRCVSSGSRVTGPKGPDDRRAHREIGYKVSIHDVDVDPIGPGLLGRHDSSPSRAKSAERIEGASFTTSVAMGRRYPSFSFRYRRMSAFVELS